MTIEAAPRGVLWTPEHRTATAGLLLVVTLVAFEAMGVATAMPTMVAELRGEALYAWPFTAFLIASVIATVLSGRLADRRGPGPALLIGPVIFLVGLLVAGLAQNMAMLLAGRVLQGLGSGALMVSFSLLIGLVFTDRERPVMYAANAAAWVLPGVIGPWIAGMVTEQVGWRWVFLGLVPLVIVGLVLLVIVVRRLDPHVPGESGRRAGVLAAVAATVGVAALTWAAQHPSAASLVYGGAALVVLVLALRGLMPAGTLLLRPGLPTVTAARGLIAGAYAGMEAFLPLTMSTVHGYSVAMAGLPLTVTALGWSAASFVQGRFPDWSREALLRTGFALVAVSLVLFTVVSQPWAPSWLAFVVSVVGGAGMGIAMPSISLLLLRFSPLHERGFTMSASQLGDWVGAALAIGLGGVLLNALASPAQPSPAMAVLGIVLGAVGVLGVVVTSRWPARVYP
ncbi:MFS transporter [Amycolatopsis suaedae]|uniref:MFS transporter n=1 Tax=Amycolatopsis suaedae TaxID=2510978 RepID=A0A4Q7JBX8_9PSEU|nr:MFS transporter [Amycolatopsis suaedae]RZQ64512.1 MFS transporter [Amycolatopsis suaedae]